MAEALLPALSKIGYYLASEVGAIAASKLSNLKELPNTVQRIRRQLLMMNLFIQKMGAVYLDDELLKGWIAEVRMLAYRVEDVMDSFSYHTLELGREKLLKKIAKGSYYAVVFSGIADELVQIEKEIEHVAKLRDQWVQSVHQLIPNQIANSNERQFSQNCLPQLMKDEDLVGRKNHQEKLIEWLKPGKHALRVISILGMGGMGKTTLVTNVYEREKENFNVHAWLSVSQAYTSVEALLKKLLKLIVASEKTALADIGSVNPRQLKLEDVDRMGVLNLKEKLKEALKQNRYMIVLDDIWDHRVYDEMQDVFEDSQNGSCILVTTRKGDVAALALQVYQLELKPLDHNDALLLFCKKAFPNNDGHKCPPELQDLADKIVKKCRGLPLAIVSIAILLSVRKQIKLVWTQMFDQLPSELEKDDQVRGILNLSYYDLPGDLRNCFLYCSMFPEDYLLSREILVRQWVAEGFVIKKGQSTLEEVAEGYLTELIYRNMLQLVDNDELDRVSTCRMHDILRELALSISKEEMFGTANDFGAMVQMDTDVRRLSVCRWSGMNDASKMKFPHLRTLIVSKTIASSIHSILSDSKYLTVLELQDSGITQLPPFIGNLFNLQYIGLRHTNVKSLPDSIEKLTKLQTLDAKWTNIEQLPSGIAKLIKLRHLLADRVVDSTRSVFRYFHGLASPIGLSSLQELQTLETIEASMQLGKQLEKMIQLRNLWIDNIDSKHCKELFASLSRMPLLSSLLLQSRDSDHSDQNQELCFDTLKPLSTKLQRLIIRGQCANKTLGCPIFRDHGSNLRFLALSWCRFGEDPLLMLAPYLQNLTYLSLNHVHSARDLVLHRGQFIALKVLVLKNMSNVHQLTIEDGAVPSIEALYLQSMMRLGKVPEGVQSLKTLKKLWLLCLAPEFRSDWENNGWQHKLKHISELRV